MLPTTTLISYLSLIALGGSISVTGGPPVVIPGGSRYLALHENDPVVNPASLGPRKLVNLMVIEEPVIVTNSQSITFNSFTSTATANYVAIWSAVTGGSLIAYSLIEPVQVSPGYSLPLDPMSIIIEAS